MSVTGKIQPGCVQPISLAGDLDICRTSTIMKKLLAALATFTALTAAASAADLPRRAAPPPVFTPVPVFTWTGAYFGINAGYAFDASDRNTGNTFIVPGGAGGYTVSGAPVAVTFRNRSQDGFSGGGQIGYNYQFTPGSGVVIGFEADAQYLDFGRNRNNAFVNGGIRPGFYATDPRGAAQIGDGPRDAQYPVIAPRRQPHRLRRLCQQRAGRFVQHRRASA